MRTRVVWAMLCLLIAGNLAAQISTPPSGNNQKASVTQHLGLVKVTIDYSSPRVHLNNQDRRGKIWGTLVPYGMANLGFGTCTECPWRAGANENTVFTTSDDIKVEGQPLKAGSYGLHMVPGQDEWTVIFSKTTTDWGSFYYDPKNDALRVKVKPAKSEYHEYLTFEFPDRELDKATVALKWEDLQVPFNISVDNISQLYAAQLRDEMNSQLGFQWKNLADAAQYALAQKVSPDLALVWAKRAAGPGFPGQTNFTTLSVLADAQAANGMAEEAKKTRELALNSPTATAIDLHMYGRSLQQQGKKEDALAVFQLNAKKHPNVWPVNVGLARAYSALGNYKEALKHAKLALEQAPDEGNKNNLKAGIAKLEQGKDMNQ
jgi:hypothetical protein